MMGGWTQSDTGKLLNISNSTVNENIRLAEIVEEYPGILKYKKKTHAYRNWRNFKKGFFGKTFGKQFKTEKELQSCLEINWKKIPLFKEWNLKESQKNIGEAGVIDILAHHNSEPKWLIVEIKKKYIE